MYEDSHTRMAISRLSPFFESISGALTKINKKSPHAADQKMMLCTHRTAPTTSTDCNRVYQRDLQSITRSTAPSQDEMLARARFATVSAAVVARKTDLMNISADKAAFNAQKDQPGGKKTFRAYLWKVCGDAYDAEHPRS